MARYDDIDTKFVAFFTLVSCLLLVAILQASQALCYNMTNTEQERKLEHSEYASSKAIIQDQLKSLTGYERVPEPPLLGPDGKPEAGSPTERIQIPIERAQELLLMEASGNKAKAAPGA